MGVAVYEDPDLAGRGRTLERSPRSAFTAPQGKREVRQVQKRLMRVLHHDSKAMRRQLEQIRATNEALNGGTMDRAEPNGRTEA